MRILDLTGIYPHPEADFEGRSVAALDRALVAAGAEVTVVVSKPWAPRWLARRFARYRHLAVAGGRYVDGGVEVVTTRPLRLPRLPESWRFAVNARLAAGRVLAAARDREPFDLVHAQSLPQAPAALLVAEALGRPLAVTLRDDLGHQRPETLHPLVRRVFDRSAALFPIGPGIERALAAFLPSARQAETRPPRVRLAPNGVDVEEIEALLAAAPPAGERDDDRRRLVSVGSLYRWKGIHEVLEALARLDRRGVRGWTYAVVGDGPYRGELEALAAELGLAGRVRFHGRLPHARALAEMRRADVFVLASWMEAFGNVFAEAAVCGLPAIGCRDNGPELIIDDGETGLLVAPRDVDDLAAALERLIAAPEEARRMGAAARRHVRDLTWERTAEIYLETYREILA